MPYAIFLGTAYKGLFKLPMQTQREANVYIQSEVSLFYFMKKKQRI